MSQSSSLSTLPGPVETLLLDLATQDATGSLSITDPNGDDATVWMRDGRIYSVSVPGRRALLGARLMSSGILAPEALGEALEIQRTELQGWRLGELLVHLGYVERAVVEAFVAEQLRDMLDDLIDWQIASSKFRNGKRTRQDVAQPSEVPALLGEVRDRRRRWSNLIEVIGTPEAIPSLSVGAVSDSIALDPHDWAMLCKIDGQRSVTDLADACGFTLLEAGEFVASLVTAGLVDVDDEQRPHEPLPLPAHLAEPDTESADSADPVTSAPDVTDADSDADADDETTDEDEDDSIDDVQRAKEALTAVIAALSDDSDSDSDEPTANDHDGVVVEMALHRAPAPALTDSSAHEANGNADDQADVQADVDPVDAVLAVIDETADSPAPEPSATKDLGDSVARVAAALEGLFGRSKSKAADKPATEVDEDAVPEADAPQADTAEAVVDAATPIEPEAEAEASEPIEEPIAPKSPLHDMASEIARQAREAARHRTQQKAERIAREESELRAAEKARKEAEEASRLQAEEAERLASELLEAKAREESERNERIKRAEEVASRVAVEAQAWAEHAEVLNAERALVETQAWSEHAIHLGQERMLIEAEAWQVHASVLEGERAGSESYAWNDHVRWLDDERRGVEAQAWQEHGDVLRVERDNSSGAAWDEHTVWLEAERLTAEPHAWQDHAAWLVQQRVDAEKPAWADHVVWLEAERTAAEALAWADHEVVVAAENATAEEAVRLDAERLVAELLEAERLEAERLEAERLAAEAAQALEALRLETARLEAERLAADEAAALEAARAEAAQLEADRQAADESRRIAAEAAAESARLAAEDAARAEAARLEAEQAANTAAAETARLEAERLEAERLEAERAEATRIEASRLLAEHAASEPQPAPTGAPLPTPAVAPSVTEEPRFDVASVLTALNRESEDLGLNAQPPPAPSAPQRDPSELQPAAAAAAASPARGSSSPPDSLARSIDSAALMRELSSLSRPQDESSSGHEGGPPAPAPVVTRPVTNGAADKNKKKRGIFGR